MIKILKNCKLNETANAIERKVCLQNEIEILGNQKRRIFHANTNTMAASFALSLREDGKNGTTRVGIVQPNWVKIVQPTWVEIVETNWVEIVEPKFPHTHTFVGFFHFLLN